MANLSKQHAKWNVGVRITHPNLNEGKPFELELAPLIREDDTPLNPAEAAQQSIHAGIVRLWSGFDTGYMENGVGRVMNDLTEALNAVYGVPLVFDENEHLAFRKVCRDASGNIVELSLPETAFNPVTGEYDESRSWLTYADWKQKHALRNTPNFSVKVVAQAAPRQTSKPAEPINFSFLAVPATSGKKTTK